MRIMRDRGVNNFSCILSVQAYYSVVYVLFCAMDFRGLINFHNNDDDDDDGDEYWFGRT